MDARRTKAVTRLDLERHREHLWGLCYRMTGSSADADDLVQDTFERALSDPPDDLERDLRPWLVRVAVNKSRDALRARKRRRYVGEWLPSPIETEELRATETPTGEARYGQLESVSFAFLLALEQLTATQRAVLLLRDVLDYSIDETATALEMSAANVKTTLHRARKALEAHDRERRPHSPEQQARVRKVLQAFCLHLFAHNVLALEALLADDVRLRNDGGGEFFAARKVVHGKPKVILFNLKTSMVPSSDLRFELRAINGAPALVVDRKPHKLGVPPRIVMWLELDASGRIRTLDAVVATPKLAAIRFDTLPEKPTGLLSALSAAAQHPPITTWAKPTLKYAADSGKTRLAKLARSARRNIERRVTRAKKR